MEHGHHHLQEHNGGSDEHEAVPFDPQDMRTMGGLRTKMKTTFAVYTIGALALSGIIPLAGFWSKDEILAHGSTNEGTSFLVVYILLSLAAICTAFYMGRQLKMVFFGQPRHEAAGHAVESGKLMTTPLVILAVLSVLGGLLNLPFFSESAAHAAETAHNESIFLGLERWLEPSLASFELSEVGEGASALLHLPHTPINIQYGVAAISTLLAVGALALALLVVYAKRPRSAEEPDPLQKTPIWWFGVLPLNTFYYRLLVPAFNRSAHWLAYSLDDAFWHDFFHDNILRDGFVNGARFLNDKFDAIVIDDFLVNGSGRFASWVADQIRKTQTGYVRNYALAVLLGVVALLTYFVYIAN